MLKCGAARGIGGISGRIAEIIVGIALAIGEATKLAPTKEARDVELVQLLSVRDSGPNDRSISRQEYMSMFVGSIAMTRAVIG